MEDTLQTFNICAGKSQQLSVDTVHHQSTGAGTVGGSEDTADYMGTVYYDTLLAHLLLYQSSGAGGVCLVGAWGCGKTALVRQMAAVLGYKTETIQLYADMTARDMLQQRTHTGDTVWRLSPLIEAALEGRMAVLDGLHRVHRGPRHPRRAPAADQRQRGTAV